MSYDSDIDQVIEKAKSQGFRYQETEKGHYQFFSPDRVNIVTTSGTPSAPSAWNNFLADMRRVGYHHNGEEAQPRKPNGGGKLSATQYVIDLIARHPEGVSPADVRAYIKSVRPDLGDSAYSNALFTLKNKGSITHAPTGKYHLADVQRPQTVRPQAPMLPVANPTTTGNDAGDLDLLALDEALVALGRIEEVVKRNRDVIHQISVLRKALGGL